MRLLLVSLVFSVFSFSAWAQSEAPADPITRGQELIEAWDNLDNQRGRVYNKYLLILEYVGPIQFEQLKQIDIQRMRNQITMDLSEDSRSRMHEFIRQYDPRNFQGPDREVARRVRGIGTQMLTFLNNMDGQTGFELVQRYESDGYSVRRSLNNRMHPYHLGPEIMKFAAAIVIVRIATCFGGSPQKVLENITTWRTPEMIAANTDPVCVDEIMDMLKSPIFYVGFSAFIAGSTVTNALTLQALKNLDPDRGPRTRAFEKNWLPNIALAVGFMADHFVKTLIQNEYLLTCGKVAVRDMAGSTVEGVGTGIGTLIGREEIDGQTYEIRDFFGGFRSSTCRRAFNSVTSHQFLYQELGVGTAGLVATAVALAKGRQLVSGAMNVLGRGARLAGFVARFPFAITLTGPVGVAVGVVAGTVHMAIFLGLFEVINPYIEQIYFEGLVKADVDQHTRRLQRTAGQYSAEHLPLHNEARCSEHYTGEQEDGSTARCSRLPLVAELYSFHDFSRTWREKHILGEFLEAHSRWKQKVTSYINNYFMSFEMLKTLTRTREMYLNFQNYLQTHSSVDDITYQDYISQVDQLEREQWQNRIQEILQEIPDVDQRENLYQDVLQNFERHSDYEQSFESPYANRPLTDPGRRIHDLLDRLSYHQFLLEILPFGTPFKGVNGLGHYPSEYELDELVREVFLFAGTPDQRRTYVEIGDPYLQNMDHYNNLLIRDHLLEIGFPQEFAYRPKQIDMVTYYMSLPSQEYNALSLLLFEEWAPRMRGPYSYNQFPIDENGESQFNPYGFHPDQMPHYERVVESLQYYSPTMPWEMWYILGTYGELPSRQKTDIDGQFDEVSHQLQTKSLADFVLSQLICGDNASVRDLFGDNGGVALQFEFPKIMDGNLCEQIVHEIHMTDLTGERESRPSPFRSVFVDDHGLRVGLHQSYIRQPENSENPLIFNKEQQAGDWWNQEIRPNTMARLVNMRHQFEETVDEHFDSRLSNAEIETSGLWQATKNLFNRLFGGLNQEAHAAQRSTSTESLTLSLVNEYYHYRLVLQQVLSEAEYTALEPDLIEVGQCLVNMVNAIPEKKYRVVRQGCENSIDNVKFQLDSRNGRYNSEESQSFIDQVPESDLSVQQRQDRVVREVWGRLNKLLGEIEGYQQMINETFNFTLAEGDIQ